jgi:PmbA protein
VDIEKTAKHLLGLIEKSDVDEGEVYVEASGGVEMEIRDQAVDRLKKRESGGYALRLISGKRMSVVHSSDLRPESFEKIVAKGADLAKAAAPDEANSLVDPAEGVADVGVCDEAFDGIPFDRKVTLLKDVETLAFACDPLVKRIENISYDDTKAEVVVANTRGVFKYKRATSFGVECSVIAEKDGEVQTGGESVGSRFFAQLDAPSRIATRACWKATSLLGGRKVSSQSAPVIFDRDASWAVLAHFASMVNGENIASGISLVKDRVGQAIASPLVTVVDDATLRGGVASMPFDGEGTACSRTVVLDRGVLRAFLFDARTARKVGAKSTGNGTRDGFRALPAVGPTNFHIENGDSAPEAIIKSTARGLWVITLDGWWMGISPATGDFSSGARGFWIENGEVAYPAQNVTIASNLLDMFQAVDAVGNDLRLSHPTVAPTLRVGEMSIGGA